MLPRPVKRVQEHLGGDLCAFMAPFFTISDIHIKALGREGAASESVPAGTDKHQHPCVYTVDIYRATEDHPVSTGASDNVGVSGMRLT